MEDAEDFVSIAGLICEPGRARMLWNLLDGRAYTATEMAVASDLSASAASNHLAKLLEAGVLKVETQGRHRYYSFAKEEAAYVIESLANLANLASPTSGRSADRDGIRYCRTCYDHIAGYVGVAVTDALERKNLVRIDEKAYSVTEEGWEWFAGIGILRADLEHGRRPVGRQCLDWSERRPHVAGQIGARLLDKAIRDGWVKKKRFSRELVITNAGRKAFRDLLQLELLY